MPTLQFLSLTVFKDHQYDPILVLEANFDGAAGPLWAQLEASHAALVQHGLGKLAVYRDEQGALHSLSTM